MKIYLFFNKRKSEYECVNEKGQNVPFEKVADSNVDFLSNQMECFGNLKIEMLFRNNSSVILRDAQDRFFCSSVGNVPFLFTPLTADGRQQRSIKGFQNFGLSVNKLPDHIGILPTGQLEQRFIDNWGRKRLKLTRQNDNNTPGDALNRDRGQELRRLSLNARGALKRYIEEREMFGNHDVLHMEGSMNSSEEQNGDAIDVKILTYENKQELERRIGCTKGEAQEGVSDINQQRYEYQADQECINFLNELSSLFLQLDVQPAAKQTSPRFEIKSQKQDRRM